MPYGQGQMLGAGVDPRMFVQDYSGFTRAAEIQAQGMQNLGTAIGNVAGQVGDYFKQQGEKKKLVKQSSLQIDAALQLFPDLAPSLQSVKERMRDENIPLSDRAAEAEVVANLINMGVGEMRNRSNMSMQREKALADAIYKEQKLGMEERRTRATEFSAMQGAKPTFDLKEATITSPDGKTFKKDIPYDKEKGMFFDPDAGKYIQDINKWGFGEPAYAEDMPPTSQVGGSINESALPAPLRKYASSFVEQGAKYGVDPALLAAISMHETANGKSSAFRNKNNAMGVSNASGPMQMRSVEASIEKIANLLGKGINQGKGPYANAKSIEDIAKRYAPIGAGNDPRGLNKYWTNGVSSNYEKLSSGGQSDNSTSMIGDMLQQAIGTPEQQAEVARMIEQGAGMATSQAAPSGAMPTEPRMTQPQPAAQQAPQYQVRPGFVLVAGAKQQNAVKIVKGQEAEAFGLDPMGTYKVQMNPDGSLVDAQVMSAPPTAEQKQKEEISQRELQQQIAVTKDKSERFVRSLEKLRDHKGFSRLFGATWLSPSIGGTKGAGAKALFEQVEAMGFMEAIKDMKGMGALSDAEGSRASIAFTGLKPDMPEEDAKAAIKDLIEVVQLGQQRMTGKTLVNPDGSPQTAQDKAAVEANNYFRSLNK
jgi:hypothetical protein